jgi:hypothetical protein
MKKCDCPYNGRRQRHYEWCPLRASNRRAIAAERVQTPLVVRVTLTINVDRAAYDNEYGTSASINDVREHVKSEAFSAVESAFANIEAVSVIDAR